MKEPLVSILINNYNYGRYIKSAIESALNQTYLNTEVIVVDDGSTDNSREVIAQYQEKITSILKENGGQASAFNAGFLASKGSIICLLDSDDCFHPEKVSQIVEAFKKNKNIGWCFHPVYLTDVDTFKSLYSDKAPRENVISKTCLIDYRTSIQNAVLPSFVPSTSGLCFTRSLLSKILPMPESEGVSISDLYIKYIALYLSQGCVLDQELTFQGIHDCNAYTAKKTLQQRHRYAEIDVLTAYWMKTNFPTLAKLTDKLMARGIGYSMNLGMNKLKYRELIQKYLANTSFKDNLKIALFGLYYYRKASKLL